MYYVLDENNNKIEAYDKQGVLAVLEQAIEEGTLAEITADSAFITKLKCCVSGITNRVAFVTQAKYNELEASGALLPNSIYFITDDSTCDDIEVDINEVNEKIAAHETRIQSLEERIAAAERRLDELAYEEIDLDYYNLGTEEKIDPSEFSGGGKIIRQGNMVIFYFNVTTAGTTNAFDFIIPLKCRPKTDVSFVYNTTQGEQTGKVTAETGRCSIIFLLTDTVGTINKVYWEM